MDEILPSYVGDYNNIPSHYKDPVFLSNQTTRMTQWKVRNPGLQIDVHPAGCGADFVKTKQMAPAHVPRVGLHLLKCRVFP